MSKYSEFDHKRALHLFMDGSSISEIHRVMGIARKTLIEWKKKGLPVVLTGGKNWKKFSEGVRAHTQKAALVKQAVAVQKSSLDFLTQAKDDVQELFDSLKHQLMDEGADKLSFGDIEKLLNIFIRLDNQAADKIIWQQDAMRKIFAVVINRVKDERIVLQIRNDLIGIAANEQQQIGDIPGKEMLPTPVEMVIAEESLLLPENTESTTSASSSSISS